MKITTFIAISQDGYITTNDHDISFLNNLDVKGDGGYGDYYNTVDVLVYGSKSFKKVKSFNLEKWPYKGKPSYVLTHSPETFLEQEDIIFTNKDILSLVKELKTKYKHLWVMGGANVINQFLDLDLLDELHISKANVYLNEGIKLFEDESKLNKYKTSNVIDYKDIKTIIYKRK